MADLLHLIFQFRDGFTYDLDISQRDGGQLKFQTATAQKVGN